MNKETFLELREKVIAAGYGDEIVWQESLKPCDNAREFFGQYMWVVISAGMKNQIARLIETRIHNAWDNGQPTTSAFGHKGKVKAINHVLIERERIFNEYQNSNEKIEYLASLPWIGDITKWHLAKNLGFDTAKPDRHLVRIAEGLKTTPLELCRKLAEVTGYRIATIDLIIWRAANLGFV